MRFLILSTVFTITLIEGRRLEPISTFSRFIPSDFSRRSLNELPPSRDNFIYNQPQIIPFTLASSSSSPHGNFAFNPHFQRARRAHQSFSNVGSIRNSRSFGGGGAASNYITPNGFSNGGYGGKSCRGGEVLHFDGTCVKPIVTNNVFVYEAPYEEEEVGPPPYIPEPELRRNIIFIRTPESAGNPDPIVVPQNQEQTIVYVLTEKKEEQQQIVHIQDQPTLKPEVYYVNYNDGENPVLPNGVDLRTALASANANLGTAHGNGGISAGGGQGYRPAPVPVSPPALNYS